ncbi:BTB/POZ protein, partial [Glomus cerebriforme]
MLQKLYLPVLTVLNNFENLFKSKKDYDVIIQAGENNQKEIYAHSVVLCCQSNYFDTAFSNNLAKKENGKYMFNKPNIPPHILENIIRYLYCGKLDLNTKNGPDVLKLLVATEEFGLNNLSEYIQKFLIENQKEFLRNDPIGILETVIQHETFTTLKNYCLETI